MEAITMRRLRLRRSAWAVMVRVYSSYGAMRIFTTFGVLTFGIGVLLGFRFLYYFFSRFFHGLLSRFFGHGLFSRFFGHSLFCGFFCCRLLGGWFLNGRRFGSRRSAGG